MAMDTKQSSTTLSFLNFLKDGLFLPSRNKGLFGAVFTLMVASTSLVLVANHLTVTPIAEVIIEHDARALNGTEPGSPDYAKVQKEIQDDSRELMITGVANLLFAAVLGSAVKVVAMFATVATYSGDHYTFGALLGKIRTQMKGPLLTEAMFLAMEVAVMALMTVLSAVIGFLSSKYYYLFMPMVLLTALSTIVVTTVISFLRSLGATVAVAEPGCWGAGALRRAWRLMKGKRWQAVLFVVVTTALPFAASPVHKLAARLLPGSVASGLPFGIVLSSFVGEAVNLFGICAMTAFYYECKGSKDVMSVDAEYVRLFMEEADHA